MNEAGDTGTSQCSSKIVCQYCSLLILKPNVGVFCNLKDVELPNLQGQKESVEEYVMVNDIFAFENVGFLRAVDEMKVIFVCLFCSIKFLMAPSKFLRNNFHFPRNSMVKRLNASYKGLKYELL